MTRCFLFVARRNVFILTRKALSLSLLFFGLLFVVLAFGNWANDFSAPAQTKQDLTFLQQYRDYLDALSRGPSPEDAAQGWVSLTGAWCNSSRLVSFTDLLRALPSPAAWPLLPVALQNSSTAFTARDRDCLALMMALLNEDAGQSAIFAGLTDSVIAAGHQQQMNRLMEVGDCIGYTNDGAELSASIARLAAVSNRPERPFAPAGSVYLPNFRRLNLAQRGGELSEEMLEAGAQSQVFAFGGDDLALQRQRLRDAFPKLTLFPKDIYLKEPPDPKLAETYVLFLQTHRDTPPADLYSRLLLNCLATEPPQHWSSYFPTDDIFALTLWQLAPRALEDGVAEPAYQFLKQRYQSSGDNRLTAALARMAYSTRLLPDVAPLLVKTPMGCHALINADWRAGRYDEAVDLTRQNVHRLLNTPDTALGVDVLTANDAADLEIARLLKSGFLLHRSDWIAEGIAQAGQQVKSMDGPNCPAYVRPIIVFRLAVTLCRIGQGREAENLIDDLWRHFPAEAKSNYFVSAARILAWSAQGKWSDILAFRKYAPETWTQIADLPLVPSLNPGDSTTPGVMRVEALANSGARPEATKEMRDLLENEKQNPSVRLVKWSLDLLGPSDTFQILDRATLPRGVADGVTARLDPGTAQPDRDVLDFQNFQRRFIATDAASAVPAANSLEEFELLWSHRLEAEAISRLSPSTSPLVNLSLSQCLEEAGHAGEADAAANRGLQELATLHDDVSWAQFEQWNQDTPAFTAGFRRAIHQCTTVGSMVDILRGRVALAEGDDAGAAKDFNLALAAKPDAAIALRYLLAMTGREIFPREAVRNALYQLEKKGPLPVRPVIAFGYADLWRGAVDRGSVPASAIPPPPTQGAIETVKAPSLLLDPDGRTKTFDDIAASRCLVDLADLMDEM